jgi:hypothetical protein
VVVCFVDIDGIVDHHCLNLKVWGGCWYWWNCWPLLFKLEGERWLFVLLILVELLTITV